MATGQSMSVPARLLQHASVRAVLPLLCACASVASTGPHEPRVASRQTSTVRTATAATAPEYWARLLVGVNAARLGDNWTDIAVSSKGDLGRKVCEAVVEKQLRALPGAGFHARIDRPCGTGSLVPVEVRAGEHVLVTERVISDVDLLLLMPVAPDELEADGGTTMTEFARFTSKRACQQALARLATIRQQDRAEAAEYAKRWLEGQVQALEQAAKQACEEKDQAEPRCASVHEGKAEIEQACSASTKSQRCREAQERALEQYQCTLRQERLARSCEGARAVLEGVRKRLTEPEAPAPSGESSPVCREF